MLHKKQKALTQTHKKPRTKTKSPHTNPQKPRQTQKAPHQPHKRPRPKTKSPSQPHKRPRPKTKSPHQNHKKAPPPQRPTPHHLMKCEQGTWRSHVPCSHFGGRGGTGPPTKKGTGPPHKKGDWSLIKKTKMYFPHRGLLDLTKRFRLFPGVMNFAWS